jgi:hypothetical protein
MAPYGAVPGGTLTASHAACTFLRVCQIEGVFMTMNISAEGAGGADRFTVSERAKRQIGLQALESKANSVDPKTGVTFLETFDDFLAGPPEK